MLGFVQRISSVALVSLLVCYVLLGLSDRNAAGQVPSHGAAGDLREAGGRPSIIFILADDLGWSELGCYGNRYHETTHIDALAR